jgi:hypothetical protein
LELAAKDQRLEADCRHNCIPEASDPRSLADIC